MAKKTGGLGKGLDALFSPVIEEEEKKIEEENSEKIHKLKLIDVEPNRNQPRRIFDKEALEDLSESIKRYGVIQPIIVSKQDGYYEIVAGERRWRAAKLAGLTEIPAIIKENDKKTNSEIALIENLQREDLNPIEKARAIKSLIDEYDLTQQKVSEILGIGRTSVTNTLRILNLSSKVIDLALEGKLTEGHCKALLSVEDPQKQYEMALYMIESGDSVREAEKKTRVQKKIKKKSKKYDLFYKDIEENLMSYFGTKVKLDANENTGKIVIKYSSKDELERILELMK